MVSNACVPKNSNQKRTYLEELASVLITIVETDLAAENANINSNTEILWHEWRTRAILLKNNLTLKESTLWNTRVNLFWLSDHDGLILKEIEDNDFSDSVILKTRLNNVLFKVTVESQDL